MLTRLANTLMSAEADAVCGAGYGARSTEQTNPRNGYVMGTSTPGPGPWRWRSPSCARGRHFPDWLLERRRRTERALTTVVAARCILQAAAAEATGPHG